MKRLKVYVAGPYTKPDPYENTNRAIRAADRLAALGLVPFVPHLTHLWHTVSPHPYRFWMDYDREWLDVCDAVLRLSGDSSGADEEVAHARSLGVPVFDDIERLVAWATGRQAASSANGGFVGCSLGPCDQVPAMLDPTACYLPRKVMDKLGVALKHMNDSLPPPSPGHRGQPVTQREIAAVVASCDPASPTYVETLAAKLEAYAALKLAVEAAQLVIRETTVRHRAELQTDRLRLEAAAKGCPHYLTTYHHNAGGGRGDETCDLCGADL